MTVIFLIILATSFLNYGNTSPLNSPFNSDVINVQQAVAYLNRIKGKTWTAGPNDYGEYLSLSEQKMRTGSLALKDIAETSSVQISPNLETHQIKQENENHVYSYDDIPDHYDARTMYPHCTTISSIKDQSICGSCWAVSTAAVFSDRLCIHSKGMINVNISSNQIMSCTRSKNLPANGCHGGWEFEAWNFISTEGAVTGGDYGTFEGCQPYSVKPCVKKTDMPCELAGDGQRITPKCRRTKCSNEWYKPEGEVYKVKSFYGLEGYGNETHPTKEIDIRREIYRNGPVTAVMLVYPPFFLYKSGIFQMDFSHLPQTTSGHSVRVIGWGVENNIPYWTVANSWGRSWGENGTFRIIRGKNYCFFETFVTAGIPDIQ